MYGVFQFEGPSRKITHHPPFCEMIEEVPISELDPRQIKQLESADELTQRNPTYAREIYGAILTQRPGCLELRKKLRALQINSLQTNTKGLSGLLHKVTSAPFMFKSDDKNPEGTLAKAEGLIDKSPSNVVAHQMLAGAASALGMSGTAVFAYETIQKLEPENLKNLKSLGSAYIEAGNTEMAIATGNSIKKINPNDGDAEEIMKKASVAMAMNKGKWEESEDFRTQLKDEDEAQALEQASKNVNDAKSLEELIRQTYEKVTQEPANLNHYRQLSDYYQRYGDLQNAIAWIQEARKQEAGQGDVSLEEKERQLTAEYFDQSIETWEKALAENPDDQAAQASLDQTRVQKEEYQRTQLESLVQRYPNEYGYRYELGMLLFEKESYDDALPHFQLAQRNAKVRLDAVLHLGRCYSRKGFHDMAIEQFESLKNEIQVMDDRKKEAIYELGCCHESMGNQEKAIEEYKLVYSADISFRDVSDKINAFYESNS